MTTRQEEESGLRDEAPTAGDQTDVQGQNALRVKVAKLLGVKPKTKCPECDGSRFTGTEQDHYPCDVCNATGRVKAYYESPDYPSDLNAAIELIDFLADRGWHCRLGNGLDKTWECEFYRDATENTNEDDIGTILGCDLPQEIHYQSADTLAEAIARAFVATMEGTK